MGIGKLLNFLQKSECPISCENRHVQQSFLQQIALSRHQDFEDSNLNINQTESLHICILEAHKGENIRNIKRR